MIRSYSFQNPRAFPMACATFETTAQKTLGTLARRDIWWSSFRWNASLIKNVIYMAISPPFSPGHATPTYSTACYFFFFFAPRYVALATALNFQMCQKSLTIMWNVQLFRMKPITAILVHWFKRYWFLAAPVSDRNTVCRGVLRNSPEGVRNMRAHFLNVRGLSWVCHEGESWCNNSVVALG